MLALLGRLYIMIENTPNMNKCLAKGLRARITKCLLQQLLNLTGFFFFFFWGGGGLVLFVCLLFFFGGGGVL